MKTLTFAVLLLASIASAQAQLPTTTSPTTPSPTAQPPAAPSPAELPATCKERAAEKKLAGAALNSFMKKCEKDATTTCNTGAADKKLKGAAKNSFVKKCVADAVGAQ